MQKFLTGLLLLTFVMALVVGYISITRADDTIPPLVKNPDIKIPPYKIPTLLTRRETVASNVKIFLAALASQRRAKGNWVCIPPWKPGRNSA